MLTALGCTVMPMPCGPETRFQPTIRMLDALDAVPAGLVLASPANPTGSMVPPNELAAIARWCDGHGTRLVSDEIYHGICYPAAQLRVGDEPAQHRRELLLRYYSMTGWRLGWLLMPPNWPTPWTGSLATSRSVLLPSRSTRRSGRSRHIASWTTTSALPREP